MKLIIGVTLVKLALAAVWGHTADITQTKLQAQAWLSGADVLNPANTGSNPSFFPLGHYAIAAACLKASELFHLPFAWIIKMPAILADAAVAWLLGFTAAGERARRWYLASPVAWLLSVYHGQLHTVAAALAAFGVWLGQRQRWLGSGVLFGLAAGVRQHFGVLLLPGLWRARGRQRAWLLLGCGVVAAFFYAPLMGGQHAARLLAPTWTSGLWGLSLLMVQGPRLLGLLGWEAPAVWAAFEQAVAVSASWWYVVWAAVFGLWCARRPHYDGWHASLFFILGLYIISPGFGVQWLIWAVPFWLVVDTARAVRFSLLAGGFIAGYYWQSGLNARYGIESVTRQLHVLAPVDLAGVAAVGLCGLATWLYCLRQAWRLR